MAAVLAALPAAATASTASMAGTALTVHMLTIKSGGTTARVTIRGDWKRTYAKLPHEHLPWQHSRSAGPNANSKSSSGNWSGYVDSPKRQTKFKSVTATYNIANLNCANSTPGTSGYSYYSAWAGLDGWNSGTVEQEGTEAYCDGDTEGLYVFYEMYPAGPVVFTGATPGDALTVTTTYNRQTGNYTLSVDDLTQNGAGVTVTTPCPTTCDNSSAEVISEAPGGGPPTYGLADYGAQSYANAQVSAYGGTSGGFATGTDWTGYGVTMVSQSTADTLAEPGRLIGGESFVDTWLAST
ncbi:MAG TPA: G1 family glutamic endopeptidase [Streptosporangiaceae bacterium]